MKVLVIGKKNHLNFDGHIVDAFKELNHNVEHFQINLRPKYFQIKRGIYKTFFGKSKGNEKSDLELSKMLIERVENFKPDLVFFSSAFFIPKIFYKVIKFQFPKIKVFAWDIDSGYNEKVNHTFNDFIDVLYVHEKGFIEENKIFFKEIRYLPLCTNPYFYKNFFNNRLNKSYFCGAWTEDRDEVFSKLTDFDIVFRGWNWDKLSKTSSNFDISNGTISLDEQLKDYNKYFAVINKHQINNTPISSLNLRVFEAPSCGALLINDYREGLENYFDLEKEICVYNCIEDLIETLERLKKEPKVFDKIRENGYRRVLNEHTYVHRLTEVHRLFNEM